MYSVYYDNFYFGQRLTQAALLWVRPQIRLFLIQIHNTACFEVPKVYYLWITGQKGENIAKT